MKNKNSLVSLVFISILFAAMLVISGCNGSTGNVIAPIDDGTGSTPTLTGSITITSTSPTTALVYVDGVYKGATPLTIRGLSKGIHTFEIKKTNYITKTVGKTIISGTNTPITVALSPASTDGTLVISSTPVSGASIYIDGSATPIGITPTSKTVSAGTHSVKIVKEGYITKTVSVSAVAGVSTTVSVPLSTTAPPLYDDAPGRTGQVYVTSIPSGATIYVDEVNSGVTPKTLTLNEGLHIIRAVKTGYTSSPPTFKTSTTAGSRNSVNFVLTAATVTGTIKVTSSEASSSIHVDGTYKGLAPQTLSLPEGSHKIKVSKTNFNNFEVDRIITAGTNPQVDAKLTAIPAATGVLLISSVPEGAAIIIDGVGKGMTTTTLQSFTLPVGSHQIKLSKANYGDKIQTVTIASGQSQTIKPVMISKTEIVDDDLPTTLGTLSITTTIGAQVYIDNAQTPLTVSANPTTTRLSVGKHTIKISKPGHSDYTQEVTISSTTTTTLSKPLTPSTPASTTGTLVLLPGSTSAIGATIKIGTTIYGTVSAGPITIPNINAGTYTLTFEKAGYNKATITGVVITKGQTTTRTAPTMTATTTATTGTLIVSSTPAGATITLTGVNKGTTTTTGTTITGLSSGNYQLKLIKAGYNEYAEQITVTAGRTTTKTITMTATTTAQSGNVYIQTTQPSTQIYVDGVYRSTTPETMNYLTTINLPVGNHEFKFIKSGFNTQIQNNYIKTSSNPRLMINLVAATTPSSTGTIALDTNPQGAFVYIDDVAQAGLTPLTVTIPIGNHKVKFVKTGYQDTLIQPTIVQGQNNKATTTLTASTIPNATTFYEYENKCGDGIVGLNENCDGDIIKLPGSLELVISKNTASSSSKTITLEGKEYTVVLLAVNGNSRTAVISVNSATASIVAGQPKTVAGLYIYISKMSTWNNGIYGTVTFTTKSGEYIDECTALNSYQEYDRNYESGTLTCTSSCTYNTLNCNTNNADTPAPLTLYLESKETVTYNGKSISFTVPGNTNYITINVDGSMYALTKGNTKTTTDLKIYMEDLYTWPTYNSAGASSQYKGVAKLTLSANTQ